MPTSRASACANIALVKYWGKRDERLNLPAAGSLSLTLDALRTTTDVSFDASLRSDELMLDGAVVPGAAQDRVSRWLDLVRSAAGIDNRARVVTDNNFPTASGLASSASAYAALALAATVAAGLTLSDQQLSVLARRGSGSAARSIYGGLVLMHAGQAADGNDAYAEPLDWDDTWPLRMVIAVVGGGVKKKLSSRAAMRHCADTSPLYKAWVDAVPGDLVAAQNAIAHRDLDALGRVAEASALAMHAAAIASRPAVVYWQPPTLACMQVVRELREAGVTGYYTMDAGPHVKVLTDEDHTAAVRDALAGVDGVTDVLVSRPGGPATLG